MLREKYIPLLKLSALDLLKYYDTISKWFWGCKGLNSEQLRVLKQIFLFSIAIFFFDLGQTLIYNKILNFYLIYYFTI